MGLVLGSSTLTAQPALRGEIRRYNTRESALSREFNSTNAKMIELSLQASGQGEDVLYSQRFTHPASWSDGEVTLHVEGVPGGIFSVD